MTTLRLLHISDVHFGINDPDANQSNITDKAITALHKFVDDNGAPPEACVFSGDITQSGKPEQFEDATQWLKRLIPAEWNCKLFITPGNHEVQRPDDEDTLISAIGLRRSSCRDSKAFGRRREKIIRPPGLIDNFRQWHQGIASAGDLPVISNWENTIACCREDITLAGVECVFIGLNTALLSCDDNDEGQLVADISSLNSSLHGTDPLKQLIVVVGHHPLVETGGEQWLSPWNSQALLTYMLGSNGPHLYLHGHVHTTSGESLMWSNGQNLTTLGAGACYQHPDYPMEFALYDIDLARQTIKPNTFAFDRVAQDWIQSTRGHGAYPVRSILPFPDNAATRAQLDSDAIEQELASFKAVYKETVNSADLIVRQLYPGADYRAHPSAIDYNCVVESDGSCQIDETLTIESLGECVHFWESHIWADEQSPETAFAQQLDLTISCDGDDKVVWLPIGNLPRSKKIAVFFLPEIKPNGSRTLRRTYRWTGLINHLMEGEDVVFVWDYKTGTSRRACDFKATVRFDPAIGDVECDNIGVDYDDDSLECQVTEAGETIWRYTAPSAKMGTPDTNKLLFRLKTTQPRD